MTQYKGLLFGILAAFAFALMNVLIKISAGHLPSSEIIFARGVTGLALLTPFVLKDVPILFVKKNYLLWVRFTSGTLAVFALFYNIQLNGAGFATALSNLASLFVVFFSVLFFREFLHWKEWIGVIIVFAGAFILNSPIGLDIGSVGGFIGLAGAVFGGIAMTSLKALATKFPPLLIVWGFCLFCGIASLMVPGAQWSCDSAGSLLILAITSILGVFGQIWVTKSYALLPVVIASAISLSCILFSVIFESIYFKTIPNAPSMLSYGMIFLGLNILQIVQGRKQPIS